LTSYEPNSFVYDHTSSSCELTSSWDEPDICSPELTFYSDELTFYSPELIYYSRDLIFYSRDLTFSGDELVFGVEIGVKCSAAGPEAEGGE